MDTHRTMGTGYTVGDDEGLHDKKKRKGREGSA